MQERIRDFQTFYRFYLTEHQNPTSRVLHFCGTALVLLIFVLVPFTGFWWLYFFIPVAGYGFAWAGHFFFEKNQPATFRYPFWSLASDFVMFWELATGKLRFGS